MSVLVICHMQQIQDVKLSVVTNIARLVVPHKDALEALMVHKDIIIAYSLSGHKSTNWLTSTSLLIRPKLQRLDNECRSRYTAKIMLPGRTVIPPYSLPAICAGIQLQPDNKYSQLTNLVKRGLDNETLVY